MGEDTKKATGAPALTKERKEGAECGAEAEDAAGASDAAAAEKQKQPKTLTGQTSHWGGMTKAQRDNWRKHNQAFAKGKRWYR